MENIYALPEVDKLSKELLETLIVNNNLKFERIVSNVKVPEEREWFDHDVDEWVVLLQGKLQFMSEIEFGIHELEKGGYLIIKAHKRHCILYASEEPPCVMVVLRSNSI